MKKTFFGCESSNLQVSPKNYASKRPSERLGNYFVEVKFFDPNFIDKYPKGKVCRWKFNSIKNHKEKIETMKIFVSEMEKMIFEDGYNPITNMYMLEKKEMPVEYDSDVLNKNTSFIKALYMALDKINLGERSKKDLQHFLKDFCVGIKKARLEHLKISDVKRSDYKNIIDILEMKKPFSGHKYNKYRTLFSQLCNELLEWDAIETNIVRDLRKRKVEKKIIRLLTPEERQRIKEYLLLISPNFLNFTLVFFHSGIRTSELLSVKAKDIDIENQRYKVLVKKGGRPSWHECYIKNIAIEYWKKQLEKAKPNDYIFGYGFVPNERPCTYNAVRLRWERYVNKELAINVSFYKLKHLNLDEVSSILSVKHASRLANHINTKMVLNHYAINQRNREELEIKSVDNEF